jgi:hypothetical protein
LSEPSGAVRFATATRLREVAIGVGLLVLVAIVVFAVLLAAWGWSTTMAGAMIGAAFTVLCGGTAVWLSSGNPSLGWEAEGLRFRIDGITVVANWATLRDLTWQRSHRWGAVEGIAVSHTRAYRRDGMNLDGKALERLDRSGFDAFVPLSLFGGQDWREGPVGDGVRAYRPDLLS